MRMRVRKSFLVILSFLFFCSFVSFRSFAQTESPTTAPTDSPAPTISPTPTPAPGSTSTPTPTCEPAGVPTGLAAASSGNTQITLTWTAPSTTVTNYILSYGTSAGNYAYGNPDISASGTTSYVVGDLTKGTTYYFAMKAENDCSASTYSSEVSATAGEAAATTPTPAPTSDPQTQAQPQNYQAQAAQQQAPQQAVQGAQQQGSGQFVSIPTFTPTPTLSPVGSTVNIVMYTGAAVVIFIVCASLFYWLQSRQKEKEQVEF